MMAGISGLAVPTRVMGLMSGTSVDAVDACLAEFWVDKGQFCYTVVATYSLPVPLTLRERLLNVMQNRPVPLAELCALNVLVAELFSETALGLMKTHQIQESSIACIGSHGQTLFHWPPKAPFRDNLDALPTNAVLGNTLDNRALGSTLQIGEPGIIAEKTGVLTIGDFRPRDMAAGGQGAPLVCFADWLLFQDKTVGRCVQNIGGIANVTVLPSDESVGHPDISSERQDIDERLKLASAVQAFDTGPGNMLIDAATTHFFNVPYDKDGLLACQGVVNVALQQALMDNAYFLKPPPKTTGREDFGNAYFKGLLTTYPDILPLDWIATLTTHTAQSIAAAYHQFVFPVCSVQEIILGGGGAKNPTLTKNLQQELNRLGYYPKINTHQAYGIPDQYKEALAFAILAWRAYYRLPNNLPSCTGASHPVIMGKWCY
jgi:anhydro-N-acetylmuramic acid kinase